MSGCGVGLRGVGAGCHRGGMLRFARRQSLSSAAGARGEPLSSVHYVFVHVHLLFHRENLRKRTKGSTNRSVDEAGGRCVCVCVCGRGKKKTVIFFFFFAASLRQVLQSGDKKNSPRRSFFKRRSALGSLVFVPGMHAMTVEISRRWSLLGGVCVCVCVWWPGYRSTHTNCWGGKCSPCIRLRAALPRPDSLLSPWGGGGGERGGDDDCILQEKALQKALKGARSLVSLIISLNS